jgi:sugar phosphate isomerase/epimerase
LGGGRCEDKSARSAPRFRLVNFRVGKHGNAIRAGDSGRSTPDPMNSPHLLLRVISCVFVFGSVRALAADAVTVPPPVPGFPIGRCVLVLNITSPEDAKTAGFEYLEMNMPSMLPLSDVDFAALVRRLRGIGIPLVSGYGFMPEDLKVVGPAVDQAKVEAAVRRGLDRAKQLGVTMVVHGNVINASRTAPAGFPLAEARKQFADFCRLAAREGAARGITVLIQPMGTSATNVINTVAEGLALVEEVNSPNLQLLVDFSGMIEGKEDFAILRKAGPHIKQIEIQNPNGRIYPQQANEADYAGFFRALKAGGYRGGFSIHGKPGDFFTTAPKALALLRGLIATELAGAPAR